MLMVWGVVCFVVRQNMSWFRSMAFPPFVTRIVFEDYPSGFMLSFLVVAVWLLWPRPERRGVAVLVFGVAASLLLGLVLMCALIVPIFGMRS